MSLTETGYPTRCAFEEVFRTSLPLLRELWEFGWAQLWEVAGPGREPLLRAEAARPAGAPGDSSLEEELARSLLDRCAGGSVWLSGSDEEGGLEGIGRPAGRLGLFPLAALPLGGAGSPAALIVLYGQSPLAPDPRRRKLAEAVAAQASLALRSAERCERLKGSLAELGKKARRWDMLSRSLDRAREAEGPELVASALAEAARRLWACSLTLVWVPYGSSDTLRLFGAYGPERESAEELIRSCRPYASTIMRSHRPVVLSGLEPLGSLAGRAVVGVPLRSEGRPVGALMLLKAEPALMAPKDERLLEAFGHNLAGAWRLWRLLEELGYSRQRLHQAEGLEALARLALGETHDFNNVLGLILGHAHLLRSRLSSAEEALDLLDVIERAVREATLRIRRLQGLKSEIAQGPRVARLDLNDVAEEVMRALKVRFKRSLAGGTTIELKKELLSPWPVLAQPELLKEALLSMIEDSMRALPKGGKLTLRTWDDLRSVHLSVSDTRLGGSKPARPIGRGGKHLAFTGGEGFATACELIKSIHGEVAVKNELGGGTTVTISLPKAEEAATSLSTS